MQQFAEPVTDLKGNAIVGALVSVINVDGSLATLYAANGVDTIDNPVTTNDQGIAIFRAPDGTYRRRAVINGVNFEIPGEITLNSPAALEQRMAFQEKLVIDVRKNGASLTATPTQNRIAIQKTLDDAAGKASVLISELYFIDGTLRIPSNTMWVGNGANTGVKMTPTVGRQTSCVQSGTRNDKRSNIILMNFTIDANRARWTVGGGVVIDAPGEVLNGNAIALNICYSENVLVRGMRCIDGYKHCIDVQAPSYLESSTNSITYDPQPSRFVWVEDCFASGAGDDNITTHFSSDIWITRCRSQDPSGIRTANTNCYEIDDGSRNIFITDCVGIGGYGGLQIKGHNNKPAPYNITVNGFRAVNNRYGIEVRHTGWYGVVLDGDTPEETVDEDGNPILYSGSSATARNVILNNCSVIAPANTTPNAGAVMYGVRIRSYENVIVSNLVVSDGSLDLGPDGFAPYTGLQENPIRVYSGARAVQMNNIAVYGFAALSGSAFYITGSFAGGMSIHGFTVIQGPQVCLHATETAGSVSLDKYYLNGAQPNGDGIQMSGTNKRIGNGMMIGYNSTAPHMGSSPCTELRKTAITSGDATGNPQPYRKTVWVEATNQNLGAGEGMSDDYYCNLLSSLYTPANGLDYRFGQVQWRKKSNSDGSALHDWVVKAIAATDGTEPTDRLVVDGDGLAVRSGIDNAHSMGALLFRWARGYFTQLFFGAGAASLTSGAGAPEAVATAAVGSIYTDTTNGVMYVKKTGTGNTGWKLVTQAA